MNFNNYDNDEIAQEFLDNNFSAMQVVKQLNPSYSMLEIVEFFASENNLISSEYELSERFDSDILPSIIETYGVKGESFSDDPMVSEAFNDWSDMLCKDGELHSEQYNQYCYVGRLSGE